jgi:hypothetical protein
MPLLAMIFMFVVYFAAKRNKLLRNKKLIFYVLLTSLILSIPALLGFIDYWFMPYVYLSLQILYGILGWYNIKLIHHFMPDVENKPYIVEFLVHFLMMFVGAALFSLIFNLCNELKYGIWASTCLLTFILPSLYKALYEKYMAIPLEIYKVWKYSGNYDLSPFDKMDYDKLLVMEVEVFKRVNDHAPTKVKAKAPDSMSFGVWFQKFISDYNMKFPKQPIEVSDGADLYGWIFYVKRSFFHRRRYIDYEQPFTQNKLKEKYTIVAKRVSEQTNEEIVTKVNENTTTGQQSSDS